VVLLLNEWQQPNEQMSRIKGKTTHYNGKRHKAIIKELTDRLLLV
jgi:hypothetical protein